MTPIVSSNSTTTSHRYSHCSSSLPLPPQLLLFFTTTPLPPLPGPSSSTRPPTQQRRPLRTPDLGFSSSPVLGRGHLLLPGPRLWSPPCGRHRRTSQKLLPIWSKTTTSPLPSLTSDLSILPTAPRSNRSLLDPSVSAFARLVTGNEKVPCGVPSWWLSLSLVRSPSLVSTTFVLPSIASTTPGHYSVRHSSL